MTGNYPAQKIQVFPDGTKVPQRSSSGSYDQRHIRTIGLRAAFRQTWRNP